MYYLALAADYDGTIAQHGAVDAETCDALRQLKDTGRRLVLVTGRELADLKHAFPEVSIFDRVVAENGGVIYDPDTGQERALASAPAPSLVEKLMQRKVEPISVGRSIVATWEPHHTAVLEVIHELGLELQIIFNKGAVMVLPPGVNKASGLKAALLELDISFHNVVGVGDAENDHAFLRACGCSAAVANALPTIKQEADIRLSGDHGAGVIELVHRMIKDDVRLLPASRHGLLIGSDRKGKEVYLEPDSTVLIAGNSGSGKSRFATLLLERMAANQFEFCVFDPEGDYQGLEHAITIGSASQPPVAEQAVMLLRKTGVNLVINALKLDLQDRRALLAQLLPPIGELRARSGRPQWLLIDEAHHALPATDNAAVRDLPAVLPGTIFITVDPESLAAKTLQRVETVLAFGSNAFTVIDAFAIAANAPRPRGIPILLKQGEILCWSRESGDPPRAVRVGAPQSKHPRHTGKYAAGDVGEWQNFHFRGPQKAINLCANNLMQFLQLSQQVDDGTWEHHLRAGDYSAWFRDVIKDDELAHEAAEAERDLSLDPAESRRRINTAVRKRYTPVRSD